MGTTDMTTDPHAMPVDGRAGLENATGCDLRRIAGTPPGGVVERRDDGRA